MSEELDHATRLVLGMLSTPDDRDQIAAAGSVTPDILQAWCDAFVTAGRRALDHAPGVHCRGYHQGADARLGALLIKAVVITPDQLREALDVQNRFGGLLGEIMIELQQATVADVLSALGDQRRIADAAWTAMSHELTPHEEFIVRRWARDGDCELLDAGVQAGVTSQTEVLRHVLAAAGLD